MNVREFKDFQGHPSALIFDEGKPVLLANYWINNFKPGLAPKSRVLLAYDLCVTLLHLKIKNIEIAVAFRNGKYLTTGQIIQLRNRLEEHKHTVEMRANGVRALVPKMACSSAFVRRCRAARDFLEAAADELYRTDDEDKNSLNDFKHALKKHLPSKKKSDGPAMVEPLHESEFRKIDEAIKNQIKKGSRSKFLIHRDLVVFHLLRELGIRNSELLGITTDSFIRTTSGHIVVHIQRNKDLSTDPRSSPATIKTLERKLRISDNLWTLIERYIIERNKIPKANNHKFLIITIKGAPLSNDALGSLFKILKENIERPLTPHTLRHSWACNFVLSAFEEASSLTSKEKERTIASSLSVLRAHMGWKLNSSMPEHYARYAFQKIGNDRLMFEERLLHKNIIDRNEHD